MAIPSAPDIARGDPELHLLLEWPERHSYRAWLAILGASILINVFFLSVGLRMASTVGPVTSTRIVIVRKTPLYFPTNRLTQKAPNTHAPSKSVDLADLLETERQQARRAAPRPSTHHFELPKTPAPPQPTAKTSTQPEPKAPKVAQNQPPTPPPPGVASGLPTNASPPPTPPPAPRDQPFQNVGSELNPSHPTLAVPKASVQGAIQSLAQKPTGNHLIISDDNISPRPIPGLPGATGQSQVQHAAVELESDPQGADFRAYLAHILSIVRTNWRRVIPESARMGTVRGRTVIEFQIDRDGSIPKLVTADTSGSDALDRAAVAGLSMSNPLPPLPADFKGFQVRLAFTFSYNLASR